MAYFQRGGSSNAGAKKTKFYKKLWFKILAVVVIILIIGGGVLAWKTGNVLSKISKGGLLSSLIHNIPGVSSELQGEKDGRINVLLLGMRGANDPAGGTLADTIMLVSIEPAQNKVAFLSIPRDLYVTDPNSGGKEKINAVHAYGEQKGAGQGLASMEKIIGEVTGLPINYAASINFDGFKQLINAIGGVDITLDAPFEEAVQFDQPHVCGSFFNVPTGKFDTKTKDVKDKLTGRVIGQKITKQYPLCTAPPDTEDCGGDFKLPAGKQTLNGDQTLCYVRSRETTSDFERAKRQQIVLQLVKDKATSIGTLADFSKVNKILDSLGDNVRTDMQLWEMQRLYDLYKKMPTPEVHQRVLENSDEGLLYTPQETPETGYILLPIGDNYDKIHDLAQNIFSSPAQSDIKPK